MAYCDAALTCIIVRADIYYAVSIHLKSLVLKKCAVKPLNLHLLGEFKTMLEKCLVLSKDLERYTIPCKDIAKACWNIKSYEWGGGVGCLVSIKCLIDVP